MHRVAKVGQTPVLEAKVGGLWKIPHLVVSAKSRDRWSIETEKRACETGTTKTQQKPLINHSGKSKLLDMQYITMIGV